MTLDWSACVTVSHRLNGASVFHIGWTGGIKSVFHPVCCLALWDSAEVSQIWYQPPPPPKLILDLDFSSETRCEHRISFIDLAIICVPDYNECLSTGPSGVTNITLLATAVAMPTVAF